MWLALTAPAGLVAGWARVLANDGAAGGDRITVATFSVNVEDRLRGLSRTLVEGRYRPGPYRRVEIPKKSGGVRPLDIPCVADRVVQTATALLLTPVIEPHLEPESYAYRPGRGVGQAVAAVARARRDGYRWAAEGDIARCFETIPHAPLLARLEGVCGEARIVDLVHLWLEAYAPTGVGLPQGSPISPLLCNLHLDTVDEAIRGRGVRLVRYADDFLLLTKTAAGAEAALERMSRLLAEHGLTLNPDKTRIRDYDRSIRFLGHVFTRGMVWKEVWADEGEPGDIVPEAGIVAHRGDAAPSAFGPDAEPELPGRRSPRQRVMYMVEAGRTLGVRNQAFVVRDDDADRLMVHASRLDRIEVGPGAEAGWPALALAAAHNVVVARVDHWGQTQGIWAHGREPRARRMLAQARTLADPATKLGLARAIAAMRAENQRRYLKHLNLSRKDADLAEVCVRLKRAVAQAAKAETLDTARGHEDQAGALFWPAYVRQFDPGFGFHARRRRPPPDGVNAAVSYLSALLERDLRVAVERAGLHPGLGALHEASVTDDPALVFDLMEAFRTPVVEALTLWLASRRALTPEMFVATEGEGDAPDHVRIEPGARKALIRGYEAWVGRPIQSRRTGKRILWRALFEEEAEALAGHFETGADFVPYRMDY